MTWWDRIREALFPPAPDYAAIWSEIVPRIAAAQRESWQPVCTESGEGLTHFGGIPALEAGTHWPVCGKCSRLMPLFLQLASADLPQGARDTFPEGLLQVFFCTACMPFEPFSNAALVRVLPDHAQLQQSDERPELLLKSRWVTNWLELPDYPEPGDTPAPEMDLDELEIEALFESGYPRQGDKLLGWPYWIQDPERPSCPECELPMTTLFQLDSNGNLDYMWGDGGVAHMFWCPHHPHAMALVWQCH